jgi:hypothetical protein
MRIERQQITSAKRKTRGCESQDAKVVKILVAEVIVEVTVVQLFA